ncbi:DEAD/DEAH box helicase [Amycolatopsis panacis]|uniref:DEAD/DEAH box helicase n=1 Tax=Amycolatopsis panacis TaxID=2340917 RepID=A0A419I7D5_9PSEU|nr:DEAD/DEAH box helicase [Amycolatopsis panacis]RJQ87712.1 DEAD/DEAH box helicase [Amycolatopsis panacis]
MEPGEVVFWRPDGGTPDGPGRLGTVDVVLPEGLRTVPARRLPIAEAVTLLPEGPSGEFWALAAEAGARLAEAGWTGPLDPAEEQWLRRLADAMPPHAHAGPVPGCPDLLPDRYPTLLRFLGDLAGLEPEVRVSLRIEALDPAGGSFRGIVQVHGGAEPLVDAAQLWESDEQDTRHEVLLALRHAADVWPPLAPLLSAAVPSSIPLDDGELTELLTGALDPAGMTVHWPAELTGLTARAVVRPGIAPGDVRSFFGGDQVLEFDWQFALGDGELTKAELDTLAEAQRPVVRLRDQWVVLDRKTADRARDRVLKPLTGIEALGVALTGHTEVDGDEIEVRTDGWLDELRTRLSAAPEPVPQPAGLAAHLRDYQLRGLHWLDTITGIGLGGCLADDMGLGKTITLIALHLHRDAGPTLVVCPTSLLGTWESEIRRFAPGTPVRRFHGSSRSLDGVDGGFVLTTYGTLRADPAPLTAVDWDLLVADEAQHVKNHRSDTAKALRTVRSAARVALTGTPVENTLTELWAILDWSTPGLLGPLTEFRERWGKPVESSDAATAERLARLLRPFLLRRRKTDPGIAPELPAKTETDRPVSLTTEQIALYEATVRELMAQVAASDGMARRGRVVKLLTALKQICNHPAQYLAEPEDSPLSGRSGKLELLDELLDTILAEDGAVLVFTQYVVMARLLQRHLTGRGIPSELLHGGTPVALREEQVRRFQRGEVPVFLLSLKAAGTGLTLTRADHVVHYDRWWNPAVEDQATDRAYRIGQTRPVQVHRLVAEGTVEDRIAVMLREKRALAESVLGGGEAALTELTDAELTELVTLRRDA